MTLGALVDCGIELAAMPERCAGMRSRACASPPLVRARGEAMEAKVSDSPGTMDLLASSMPQSTAPPASYRRLMPLRQSKLGELHVRVKIKEPKNQSSKECFGFGS